MKVHGFQGLTENFHPYHTDLAEPTQNPMPQASRETKKRRIHDPAWIKDLVN